VAYIFFPPEVQNAGAMAKSIKVVSASSEKLVRSTLDKSITESLVKTWENHLY
jgi:hypothetical protein